MDKKIESRDELVRHVFIVGAKGFIYGGYETFLDRLTEYHKDNKNIKYHIACKANGNGRTDESLLDGVKFISDTEYEYHNAHCFKIKSPNLGTAQAIFYDVYSLNYVCCYIKDHNIEQPIVYILSSRIGFAMRHFARKIHKLGGVLYHNPDGLEFKRGKYSAPVRRYWKESERNTVRYADLEICDSKNIQKYIKEEYKRYNPKTTFIAYGADIPETLLADDDPKYVEWLKEHELKDGEFYISVGRFVPENNFETMIREFMKSNSQKDFAIITTYDSGFLRQLDDKLNFSTDKRIKFVGTVYDRALLQKIRANAYGYFHGHEVGGTNPSLLESLGITKLNLLYDVGFNKEVAEDAAFYWSKADGDLARLINEADGLISKDREQMGMKAKKRILEEYNWKLIADKYARQFL